MTGTATRTQSMVSAGAIDTLKEKGAVVVRAADRPVVVFYNDGDLRAVDNRCPHMGFPLHKGSCEDGMITCHWHHARFDACSGCTFDLWADDVEPFDIEVRNGQVYVSSLPRPRDVAAHALHRLRDGMRTNISLIQAKAILALRGAGVSEAQIVREAALFGADNRDDWASGLTSMTAMANLAGTLGEETAFLALYQGVSRVAADCAGQAPRRPRQRLESDEITLETLGRWLRRWTVVRHRDGAERTLLTAIESGASQRDLAWLLFGAATERPYASTGHLLDFLNKAFELLDMIGWEHAGRVLPGHMAALVSARGGEESNAWRHPIDLLPLVRDIEAKLPELLAAGRGKAWSDEAGLAERILADDPHAILDALSQAIEAGATAEQLGKSLAYAAAMRVARFGTSNEISDWIGALHTFSYCNALHQALKRCDDPVVLRGVVHGALAVYLIRFLNVPPARLPGEKRDDQQRMDALPTDADELRQAFLDRLDTQQRVDEGALIVARYLALGHPADALIDTLTYAAVREDVNFHTLQMVEAGVRQYREWGDSEQGRNILIAVARYLAAHSPTQRAQLQTADIALRLHRGDDVYEDDDAS